MDAELDAKLWKVAERMSAPYREMSLAAVIRAALVEGLAVLEAKFPPPNEAPRPRTRARRAPAARKKKQQQ